MLVVYGILLTVLFFAQSNSSAGYNGIKYFLIIIKVRERKPKKQNIVNEKSKKNFKISLIFQNLSNLMKIPENTKNAPD